MYCETVKSHKKSLIQFVKPHIGKSFIPVFLKPCFGVCVGLYVLFAIVVLFFLLSLVLFVISDYFIPFINQLLLIFSLIHGLSFGSQPSVWRRQP